MPIFQCFRCPWRGERRWVEASLEMPCPLCQGPTHQVYRPAEHPSVVPYRGLPAGWNGDPKAPAIEPTR